MTRSIKQWQRNTLGLRANAQKKATATEQRAEAAISLLIREQRPINFQTVAQTAGISTAWLYGNMALKERIMHLRAQQTPKAQVKIPPKEQASSASKYAMIAALQKRVKEQAAEIQQLKHQGRSGLWTAPPASRKEGPAMSTRRSTNCQQTQHMCLDMSRQEYGGR